MEFYIYVNNPKTILFEDFYSEEFFERVKENFNSDILEQYKRLLKEFNCNYELNIKYKFKNFNSLTPFIDSEEYMVFISENGLPINLKTSIDIPLNGYIVNQFKNFNVFSLSLNIISATSPSRHLVDEISNGYGNYLKHKSKNKQ